MQRQHSSHPICIYAVSHALSGAVYVYSEAKFLSAAQTSNTIESIMVQKGLAQKHVVEMYMVNLGKHNC